MFSNKIIFCSQNKEMVDVWPNPKPASHFIPDEYKKLKRFSDNNFHKPTLKTCMPFLDAITAGYIIPFDQDYLVEPTETDFSVTPANREQMGFGYHNEAQLPKDWKKHTGENAGKFHNKWLIKTPPGHSCLFIKPMNRLEERFDIISGVVDTDTYINLIHFPFILKKRDEPFLIKKGEPMIQVIPFKRQNWKMWAGFYWEKLHNMTANKIHTLWIDRYKTFFWKRKTFK